jgi:hypothetical protein
MRNRYLSRRPSRKGDSTRNGLGAPITRPLVPDLLPARVAVVAVTSSGHVLLTTPLADAEPALFTLEKRRRYVYEAAVPARPDLRCDDFVPRNVRSRLAQRGVSRGVVEAAFLLLDQAEILERDECCDIGAAILEDYALAILQNVAERRRIDGRG